MLISNRENTLTKNYTGSIPSSPETRVEFTFESETIQSFINLMRFNQYWFYIGKMRIRKAFRTSVLSPRPVPGPNEVVFTKNILVAQGKGGKFFFAIYYI